MKLKKKCKRFLLKISHNKSITEKMTLKDLKKELNSMTIPNQLKIGAKNFKDVQKTIDSHIRYLEANKGNKAFMPYWYNLLEIYDFVTAQPKKK